MRRRKTIDTQAIEKSREIAYGEDRTHFSRSQSERFDPQLNYIGKSPKRFVAQPEETLSTKLAISSGCCFPRLRVAATTAYVSPDDIIISLSLPFCCAEIISFCRSLESFHGLPLQFQFRHP